MFRGLDLQTLLISFACLLPAIVLHELAHGYMALALGDDTAKRQGRLTLNPLAHLNLTGFLSLLIFRFGWANPVPVNFNRLRHGRWGIILVSLADIGANLIAALLSAGLFVWNQLYNQTASHEIFNTLLSTFLIYNVSLAVFNLMPFPPLDGSKVILSLLPYPLQFKFYKYEQYFYFILIALIFTNVVSGIIGPIIDKILYGMLDLFLLVLSR